MKTLIATLALASVSSFLASTGAMINFGNANSVVENVSVISLIANPEKYSGKPIRVIGAFRLEFEGNALCLHKEDLDNALTKNCLWIEPDFKALHTDRKTLSKFNGRYVLVEGTFDKDDTGHMGLSSGSITGIWRVALWENSQ